MPPPDDAPRSGDAGRPGDATLARLRALADLRRWPELEAAARDALAAVDEARTADVFAHLARALLLQDRHDEAIDAARAGLASRPGDEWLGRVLASALVAAGRLDDAADVLDRLMAVDPNRYHVRVLASRVALRRADVDAAKRHAREAILADGARAGGYVMLAAALSQAGTPLESEVVARQGLSVDPNSGDLHCQLAVALERTGRRSEAATHWVEAGRVGRYPEVAVDGLRQLMVDPPMLWVHAVTGLVVFAVVSTLGALGGVDAWLTFVVGVACAGIAAVAAGPLVVPRVRARRRASARAALPTEARAVLDLAGDD